jgi:hypothetical protein
VTIAPTAKHANPDYLMNPAPERRTFPLLLICRNETYAQQQQNG